MYYNVYRRFRVVDNDNGIVRQRWGDLIVALPLRLVTVRTMVQVYQSAGGNFVFVTQMFGRRDTARRQETKANKGERKYEIDSCFHSKVQVMAYSLQRSTKNLDHSRESDVNISMSIYLW